MSYFPNEMIIKSKIFAIPIILRNHKIVNLFAMINNRTKSDVNVHEWVWQELESMDASTTETQSEPYKMISNQIA